MKERLSRTNEELHGVRQDLENTRRESDEKIRKLEEDLERKTEEIKRLKADKNDRQDLENTMRVFNEKIRRYEEDLERKTEKIKHLEAENRDLLNRLSFEAAARMTYNNPNITDLSDQGRPTKISERYTELYDNQWTDAFQNLQNSYQLSDTKAIEVLLDVLYISFGVCKNIRKQREALVQNINEFVGEAGGDVIVSDVMTTLKGAQKKNIAKMHKDYAKKVQEVLKTKYSKELQCIGPYVIECVELCLLMNIQDQPLELRGVVSGQNPVFDVAVFRPYTKSGSRIEHMVWPALYLHNNGPLLCRGVAQGMRDPHKSTIIKVDTSKKNV
ncbi:hypothetical protein ACJMK2_031555 [Sinanodonta woodiana]|uniref:Mitochondria-eating protein n=1 Tax=Sinanodonta woodiana TaxID=1069815 RepID=A0ABD3X322_SINWO